MSQAYDSSAISTENVDSLFVNIVSPSSFTRDSKFPVKVYIHGGYASRCLYQDQRIYISTSSGSSSSALLTDLTLRPNTSLKNAQRSGSISDTAFRCLVSLHATSPRSTGISDSRINGSHCDGFRKTLKDLEVIVLCNIPKRGAHKSAG